jgi:hypothetical protein
MKVLLIFVVIISFFSFSCVDEREPVGMKWDFDEFLLKEYNNTLIFDLEVEFKNYDIVIFEKVNYNHNSLRDQHQHISKIFFKLYDLMAFPDMVYINGANSLWQNNFRYLTRYSKEDTFKFEYRLEYNSNIFEFETITNNKNYFIPSRNISRNFQINFPNYDYENSLIEIQNIKNSRNSNSNFKETPKIYFNRDFINLSLSTFEEEFNNKGFLLELPQEITFLSRHVKRKELEVEGKKILILNHHTYFHIFKYVP